MSYQFSLHFLFDLTSFFFNFLLVIKSPLINLGENSFLLISLLEKARSIVYLTWEAKITINKMTLDVSVFFIYF